MTCLERTHLAKRRFGYTHASMATYSIYLLNDRSITEFIVTFDVQILLLNGVVLYHYLDTLTVRSIVGKSAVLIQYFLPSPKHNY